MTERRRLPVSGYGLLITLLFLALPLAAQAQPFVPCDGPSCTLGQLLDIPARIYNWATGLAVSILLLLIMYAGVRYLIFYFSDAPDSELKAAKNTLRYAISGFVIVMLSYLIVRTLLAVLGANTGAKWYTDVFR